MESYKTMRIISGTLKGRSIDFLSNAKTRPLKDAVKENVFNILKHSNLVNVRIENSNVLDLYSGIGSFGIECISRGAKKVAFIEQDMIAANTLKKNLVELSIENKSIIYRNKIEDVLQKDLKEKYHIFFLDPPFSDIHFYLNLKLAKEKKIFEKNHVVIIHREKKSRDEFKDILNIIKINQYGRSKIIFGFFS